MNLVSFWTLLDLMLRLTLLDFDWTNHVFFPIFEHGLDVVLVEVLPNCTYRYCVQHIYYNFKKIHWGEALKNRLRWIERATNKQLYNVAMNDMENYDSEAFIWIMSIYDPITRCKTFFLFYYEEPKLKYYIMF